MTSAESERAAVASAIMETRVRWGWTFGKRRRVMAIDLMMAEAAIEALNSARSDHLKGQSE